MAKETPKQYTGRKLRRKIELAKVAVMEAQQSATEYRGDMATCHALLDAAFRKLDRAWAITVEESNG